MYPFNVRVYGILINDRGQVLLSDEEQYGFRFIKFPGGGLEYGEGPSQAVVREFMEECDAEVEVLSHFYTTDFFIQSAFNDSQVISIYYLVKPLKELTLNFKETIFDFDNSGTSRQSFRWKNIAELEPDDVTFPIDRKVVELLKTQWQQKL